MTCNNYNLYKENIKYVEYNTDNNYNTDISLTAR